MPQPHEVGSILGGRYKVTGAVTTSADRDLVLDGIDQVLDRKVSILVAGPENAEQMAASAREIATGERPGNVQVLDLGQADGSTYLVTNHASAADLLDLVVAANPPYVEPFFTDTLGTEIFGQERSTEPEYYDDRYEQVQYDDEPTQEPHLPTRPAAVTPPPPHTPPRNMQKSPEPTAAAGDGDAHQPQKPKVTLWSDDDYGSTQQGSNQQRSTNRNAGHAGAAAAGATAAGTAGSSTGSARAASHFPASARGEADNYDDYDEAEEEPIPRFTRWLAGALIAILLVAAAVLAVTQLGSMFSPPVAGSSSSDGSEQTEETPSTPSTPSASESASPQDSESASESATPSAEAAEPVINSIVRIVPDDPDLDSVNDGDLPLAIDDNPVTAWNSLVYANNTFGGFASNLALVVGLEENSSITEVQLEQLNGSGGSFEVLLNDEPSLEGADQVAQGGFTSPSITIPISAQDGAARTAEYVIINFTQLPRLSNSNGPFPWGVKLAEIDIS